MKLTHAERWILANQYEILKLLSDGDVALYDQAIEILSNGYEEDYDYASQYVRERTLSPEIVQETKEILYMFEQMQWVKEKAELTDPRHIALFTFWGFDGNNNHERLSYADFVLRRGDERVSLGWCDECGMVTTMGGNLRVRGLIVDLGAGS